MEWLVNCSLTLFYLGRTAAGDLLSFDLSPLRQNEPCIYKCHEDWQRASGLGTMDYCGIDNFISLSTMCERKTAFLQRIEHIRNASANRAVAVTVLDDDLIDAAVLGPIGRQIVSFRILEVLTGNITARLPAIGLDNLLNLRFIFCRGLRIHKTHFSGMHNIRAIEFWGSPPKFVEPGTFTNLPTLLTLALGNGITATNWGHPLEQERFTVWQELKCDAENSWLWEFLTGKPGLRDSRKSGEIVTLGNFTSKPLVVNEPDVNCEIWSGKAV